MAFDASSFWYGWQHLKARTRAFLQVTAKGGDAYAQGSDVPGVAWAQVVAITDGVADAAPLGSAANPINTIGGTSAAVTPAAGTAHVVTTGGAAVTAITGPTKGGYIINPPNAAGQGIATAEALYLDMVGTPGSTDAGASGTTLRLQPGDTFTLPALAAGVNVKVNAATSAHAFTCVKY